MSAHNNPQAYREATIYGQDEYLAEVNVQKRALFQRFLSNDLKTNLVYGLGAGIAFSLVTKRPLKSVLFFTGVGAGASVNNLADRFNQLQRVEHRVVLTNQHDDFSSRVDQMRLTFLKKDYHAKYFYKKVLGLFY